MTEALSLFDSHCHLENERFQGEVDKALERMADAHVDRCLLAGSDMETSRQIVALCEAHENMYGAVGVHPHEASGFTKADLDTIEEWLQKPQIVAIGEIGLDYYYDHSPRETQREVFLSQLELAYQLKAPIVIHVRDAHGDLTELLRQRQGRLPAGVLHCYSGSLESARQYLDWGFYLSFSGTVTFKNADKLRQVVAYCPLDRMLIETDSPYLAPVPHRGERNEPSYVAYVAQTVAQTRDMPISDIAAATRENAMRLFGIDR